MAGEGTHRGGVVSKLKKAVSRWSTTALANRLNAQPGEEINVSSLVRWTAPALAACLGYATLSSAQTNAPAAEAPEHPAAEPALTPGELYKQAMHPLDVVRSSMDNWSDAEMGAFVVGMHMAREACGQANAENYTGDDLYDLARLCSLGQDWNSANTAATRYLDSRAEPHRTQAFALGINALMHMNGKDLAIATARVMMWNQPYDAEVAYAIRYLKDELEQGGDPGAIPLAETEHAHIVKALELGVPLKAVHGDAVISMGALCESAMELAFWQRYGHDDADAATTVSEIDAALAKGGVPAAEDKVRIEAVRTQYALLGKPLPAFKTSLVQQAPPVQPTPKSRVKAAATPAMQIGPDYGAATVLVLFPDWCPQCRKMMKTLSEFGSANKETPVYAYGLMFLDDPASVGQKPEDKGAAHEQNLKEVQGTNTLLLDASDARAMGVLDFPLGIVLDHGGKVQYVGVLPGDAFNGNGYVNKVIERMTASDANRRP